MAMRRKVIAGAAAALAVGGAGAGVAATKLTTNSPSEESKAIVNDAAKSLGVEPSKLSAALKKAFEDRIDAAVADGRLTKAQGDELKQRIESGELAALRAARLRARPRRPARRSSTGSTPAATYLGLTEAELHSRLESGKTLAEIAKAQGKSVDGLKDAMVKDAKTKLDAAVKAGRLSSRRSSASSPTCSSTSTTSSTASCPIAATPRAASASATGRAPRRSRTRPLRNERARARYAGRVRKLAETIEAWRARGDRVALATVVATRRSAPRPVGAKLAVSERGDLHGSVSGGCVESDVAVTAAEVLADGRPRLLTYGIEDEQAWSVGLPCGGEIDVFVEPFEGELPQEPSVTLTVLEGERAGERIESDVPPGPSRVLELDGVKVFAEVLGPPPRLVVVGGIDTAEELCRGAKALGWRTEVIDPRPALVTRERLPSPDELTVAWPDELTADADTAVVVLTHEERLDVPALVAALGSDAFYVGAIGSRRTQAKRRERLLEAGLSEEQLERLAGPAGLDLGAHTPAETAVSILAEVLAVRAGRTGGRLVERSGPIHATA